MAQSLWQMLGGRRGWVIMLSLLLIGMFQFAVPIFSDEAYFVTWGLTPAAGYYDHPPLTGWISAALIWLGDQLGLGRHGGLHRVFSLVLGAGAMVLVFKRLGVLLQGNSSAMTRNYLMAALALLPGTLLLFNMFVNDTLVAFSSLVFLLALHDLWRSPKLSLFYLGLAALSLSAMLMTKYSAAIIYLAVVVALPFITGGIRFLLTRLLTVSLIAAIPFLWHLWWNYNNCAVNFAFNFSFRNETPSGGPVPAIVGSLLLVTGSMWIQILWLRFRRKGPGGGGQFFAPIFLATLFLSALIALTRGNFGANWAAVYGFLAILALAETANERYARFAARFSTGVAIIISLPVLLVFGAFRSELLRPDDFFDAGTAYRINANMEMSEPFFVAALQSLATERVYGAKGYGMASMMKNMGLRPAVSFSLGVYGRNDDLFVDLREFDGQDFLLFAYNPSAAESLARDYFSQYETHLVPGRYGDYQVILADSFQSGQYIENQVKPFIRDHYGASPFPYRSCPLSRYGLNLLD